MISITITKKDGVFKSLECRGHAGYDAEGRDIVCAAASMLVFNTVNSIEAFTEDAFTLDTSEKEGMLHLTFTEEVSHDSEILMKSLVMGLKDIEKYYGKQYLKFVYKEV